MEKKKRTHKKRKINGQQIVAILLLIAMIGSFIASVIYI